MITERYFSVPEKVLFLIIKMHFKETILNVPIPFKTVTSNDLLSISAVLLRIDKQAARELYVDRTLKSSY